MAERMTRYQLAFAPFLNKYINDELSKHYGGRRVTGVLPGLQNQCGAWYVPGGFDSHVSAKRKEKEYGYESDAGVRTSAHRLFW